MHTGPGPEPRPALDQLIAHIAALKQRRNASWSALEQQTGITSQALSAAAQGHQPGGREWRIPSDSVIIALDRGLRADGSLFERWVQVKREDEEIRLGRIAAKAFPAMDGLPPPPGQTVDRAGEARTTDRRLFGVGGLSVAAVLAFAGDVDDQLQSHRPKITDVADAETALANLERDRDAADPADLFPPAYEAWTAVEGILPRRVHPAYVPKLTLLAGTLAAGLSTVASFAGHERFGRVFAGIAEVHANAAGEPALRARVAGIQSWQALDAGLALDAADIAARGRQHADPADRARLAAYEAEAAAAGLYSRADEAVAAMRTSMRAAATGRPAIAWGDANEQLFTALTAAQTPGRATVAITLGTRAAESFDRPCQGMALAHLAVATGYVRKDRPAPDVAAASAVAALDIVEHAPNAEVHDRARRLATELSAWSSESLVQELDQRTAAL
ncbi:conserved hypothetical protein [Parafrankia sp. EAN1pec]|uniref:hypothetical protein n=1 Tax=Parafrankia sp. (strain EAN1pec) TaxID=298653 RepID=UPI0000540F07|nr:conserved hypothetical protein [Frankia sp. EAN1pec]